MSAMPAVVTCFVLSLAEMRVKVIEWEDDRRKQPEMIITDRYRARADQETDTTIPIPKLKKADTSSLSSKLSDGLVSSLGRSRTLVTTLTGCTSLRLN